MTDFFTMPGGVVNLPDSPRSTMSYAQPPGNTAPKPDDGGIVRFNTVDWEARAKVAVDGAEGLREAIRILHRVSSDNQFGDLVEGEEVANRLANLLANWKSQLTVQGETLDALAQQCTAAGQGLLGADSAAASNIQT